MAVGPLACDSSGWRIERGTLGGLLARSAAEYGPRVALRYRDAAITYAELQAMARRVAGALQALPAARDGVALLLGNTAFHPAIVFGAAPTAATPHASTAARAERRSGFSMAVTPMRRLRPR